MLKNLPLDPRVQISTFCFKITFFAIPLFFFSNAWQMAFESFPSGFKLSSTNMQEIENCIYGAKGTHTVSKLC